MKKFAIMAMLVLITLTLGCNCSNQKLAGKMIEKYSDNQNYVTLSGEIVEFNDNNAVIKCEELSIYISYQNEICDYYIYSDKILDLAVNDKIEFVTVPFHFYNGHKLPIVELEKNGDMLLAFEDGKKNLLDWVNTYFK